MSYQGHRAMQPPTAISPSCCKTLACCLSGSAYQNGPVHAFYCTRKLWTVDTAGVTEKLCPSITNTCGHAKQSTRSFLLYIAFLLSLLNYTTVALPIDCLILVNTHLLSQGLLLCFTRQHADVFIASFYSLTKNNAKYRGANQNHRPSLSSSQTTREYAISCSTFLPLRCFNLNQSISKYCLFCTLFKGRIDTA